MNIKPLFGALLVNFVKKVFQRTSKYVSLLSSKINVVSHPIYGSANVFFNDTITKSDIINQ